MLVRIQKIPLSHVHVRVSLFRLNYPTLTSHPLYIQPTPTTHPHSTNLHSLSYTCTDIDECLSNSTGCSVNANCSNTPGNFTCTCKNGYQGNGFTCTGACVRFGVQNWLSISFSLIYFLSNHMYMDVYFYMKVEEIYH